MTHSGVYDGDFYNARYHPECDAAISRWWVVYGRDDEFPQYLINRGGIEERGEPEKETLPANDEVRDGGGAV